MRAHGQALRLSLATSLAAAIALAACERGRHVDRAVVVPVAPPADASALVVLPAPPARHVAAAAECTGTDIGDSIAARVLPLGAARYCADGALTKAYGEDAKHQMSDVCTTLFDGECEVYLKLGVRRVVSLRYVSTVSTANAFYVVLSRFVDARGAEEMFELRTRGSSQPMRPLTADGAAVLGPSVAYVWRGQYLVEIGFETDDSTLTKDDVVRVTSEAGALLACRIEERLRPL